MERNYTIDFIKFFAIYFVVVIHTGPFKNEPLIYETINIFARFAVPFFFMTSGYFLGKNLQTKKDPGQYIKKSFIKNLSLYITWIFIFFVYDFFLTILFANLKGVSIGNALTDHFSEFFTI